MSPAFTLALTALVLTACGGGSDGGSGTTAPLPAPVATTAQTTSVPASPTVSPASIDANCGLNSPGGIQAEVLQRVNALRSTGAVCGATSYPATTPLIWNSLLLKAATGHSADMASNNYFSHTSLDGRTLSQRVLAAGYNYSAAGENIAAGQRSVESAMAGWINSPGHCQNLMEPLFRDIAVACVRNDSATYSYYWTMDLGRTR
ncbi:CAP domain-containing protein [Polaromonas sp.]|uniref:CAP domain-containing protein n=1 Tax=Polaromonas sp. TaxID=1869339 RepID=UPI00286B5B98|nr:CAP domain-containing protein [Polaromonas sp.]